MYLQGGPGAGLLLQDGRGEAAAEPAPHKPGVRPATSPFSSPSSARQLHGSQPGAPMASHAVVQAGSSLRPAAGGPSTSASVSRAPAPSPPSVGPQTRTLVRAAALTLNRPRGARAVGH